MARSCRERHPARRHRVQRLSALDRPLALLDGPGGSPCPDEVIDAIANLHEDDANIGAPYETSVVPSS